MDIKDIYTAPSNALRFVIMQNQRTKEYVWLFASKYTSHIEMAKTFQNEKEDSGDTDYWNCTDGGFYCYRMANAIDFRIDEPKKLELFGKSDGFGLHEESYNAAMPFLLKTMDNINQFPDLVIDDTWIKSYFERNANARNDRKSQ